MASGAMRVNLVDYYGRTKHRSLAVAARYFHHVLSRDREGAVLVSLSRSLADVRYGANYTGTHSPQSFAIPAG